MTSSSKRKIVEILRLLRDRRNVLVSGAPGTGKSRLLSQVAHAFKNSSFLTGAAKGPVHVAGEAVAIPKEIPDGVDPEIQEVLPEPSRKDREVFRTTFHQNSKYREFVTGLVPAVGKSGEFRVMEGTLYRASEHGKKDDAAALLIIDEINRGPAVQVFGGSIVAIEPDKRLADDNSQRPETQFFEILDPGSGDVAEYALPSHLYILAAMNQADTSVEPLDVAFLRRWAPYKLAPEEGVLREVFGLSDDPADELPENPDNEKDVLEAAVQALSAINRRIALGRGEEFQLGHGVFLTGDGGVPTDVDAALHFTAEMWSYMRSHVDEVFFGDLRGVAATLNVAGGSENHPYKLEETTFADEPRVELTGPADVNAGNIYSILRAVVET